MTVNLYDYDTDLSVGQAHPTRPGAMMKQRQGKWYRERQLRTVGSRRYVGAG